MPRLTFDSLKQDFSDKGLTLVKVSRGYCFQLTERTIDNVGYIERYNTLAECQLWLQQYQLPPTERELELEAEVEAIAYEPEQYERNQQRARELEEQPLYQWSDRQYKPWSTTEPEKEFLPFAATVGTRVSKGFANSVRTVTRNIRQRAARFHSNIA